MGDISTIKAAIVSALEGEASITANIITAAPGTIDNVLDSDDITLPAVVVTYEGAEYQEHDLLGARLSDAVRTWRIYAIAKATGASSDVDADAADLLELVVSVLQGVTVDGDGGELWPSADELVASANGRAAYAVDIYATTRMVGI